MFVVVVVVVFVVLAGAGRLWCRRQCAFPATPTVSKKTAAACRGCLTPEAAVVLVPDCRIGRPAPARAVGAPQAKTVGVGLVVVVVGGGGRAATRSLVK